MLTRQAVFNRMWSRMRKQGKPSVARVSNESPAVQCRYRTDSGLCCPVGHLIPDSIYSPDIETRRVETLLGATMSFLNVNFKKRLFFARWRHNLLKLDVHSLLSDVQRLHDDLARKPLFAQEFELGMQQIAHRYGLKCLPEGY